MSMTVTSDGGAAPGFNRIGVWCFTDHLSSAELARFACSVESWGYGSLWQPESLGRNVLVASSWLLATTRTLTIATGIANIYARDALATAAAHSGLAEQSGGRFLLGLGVSHAPLVEGFRGHHYDKPVAAMRAYLEAMARAPYMAVAPTTPPPKVLAALGPKMLELSGELADGAHTYNVTPEHTQDARRRVGPGKLLCVEQKIVLDTDPARARATARATLGLYLGLRNYQENWRRQGFSESDWSAGGSDRLVDAMVAWGDESALLARIQAHWDAGASHVCIQPLAPTGFGNFDADLLERLAPKRDARPDPRKR
jgi:probable F420-dependent oxidoreductase